MLPQINDASNHNVPSPLSVSSSTSSSNGGIKIRIKLSATSLAKRRSQRRRMNPQPPMRTSSLTTTILHTNSHVNNPTFDSNNDQQIEKYSPNNLVFTTTSKANTKSSYWTVTDREPEWYKLAMPANLSISDTIKQMASYRKISTTSERNTSRSNQNDQIGQPIDTTQLIMKAVMHELDYDIDDNDLKFLHELNSQQKRQITEEEFENAIIILEFSTAEKIRSYLKQKSCENDDIVCDICLSPDADDGNEMVFCERCNCCVHQNCYGIPHVPSGTWLCRPCSILRRPSCILCSKLGGPMKCTASGTIWCHLTCALWLPELKFVDYVTMEPVLHLDKISHARWSLRCVVCSTLDGACVQCAHKNCRTPFHVTCGLAAGYFLDIQQTTSKESTSMRSQFNAYCFKHSDEARKRSEQDPLTYSSQKSIEDDSSCSSSSSSSSPPSLTPLTVYQRDQLRTEQWINECYKKFSTFISSSYLHEESPQDYDENLSKRIYEYWINKRQFHRTMPLIKRIDFVLEQRENAELLIAQINTCLKTRQTIRDLQNQCKTVLDSHPSSTILAQRFESLKKTFSSSSPSHRQRCRRRHRQSSSTSSTFHGENDHGNVNELKAVKRRRRKLFYSTEQYQTIVNAKRCRVSLESTYRYSLQLNTTYLIRTLNDGQMILLPKELFERISDKSILPSTDYSQVSDDGEDLETPKEPSLFQSSKTSYASHGNVVTCVTGSFN
ncbi:unnamed protein product [Adineta ricciae]|uniref:Uncharacterized protein n=1 Tax=Adineta ricciae TaxID=249248 RepID=A0A813ZIV8_ADIRI|nr:unnamed protein product [Adineta ricciae]CAF1151851.1 unnamed protein product [Adineta ricciae]